LEEALDLSFDRLLMMTTDLKRLHILVPRFKLKGADRPLRNLELTDRADLTFQRLSGRGLSCHYPTTVLQSGGSLC
jgi:hypothetical protein